MAGFLGVITRLRNPLLASLRDSPKPRPDLHLVIQGSGHGIGVTEYGGGLWVTKYRGKCSCSYFDT